MKTAIIIGATGLVGNELLKLCLRDDYFTEVKIFVRRKSTFNHPKLKEEIVDFDNISVWRDRIRGDILFSAMGTTLKQAGSKEAQYKVDYTYQYEIARAADQNRVPEYVLVSAPGANPDSMMFYPKIKGQLDRDVQELSFERIVLIKPSILEGERNQRRTGEEIGLKVAGLFRYIPLLKKYRPISGKTVAAAMIKAIKLKANQRIQEFSLNELFDLASPSESDS